MSEFGTSRHCWSWRNCFASVKHNKRKRNKQQNDQRHSERLSSNTHAPNKLSNNANRNSHILYDSNVLPKKSRMKLYDQHSTTNNDDMHMHSGVPFNESHIVEDPDKQLAMDDMTASIINDKSSSTIRTTQLDVIIEDSNEDISEDNDETLQSIRLHYDTEIIKDLNDLYFRLIELSQMNYVVMQFNDHDYLFNDFLRQISKFKLTIDDIKRTSLEKPIHVELLGARYSTILATIENLSLLLKISQIASLQSFINRLIFSIEQKINQLKRYTQRSSSTVNLRQQRQDLNEDDFLSFRSALSSYEHLWPALS